MLWGYSDSDINGGAAVKLVEFLDHEQLDYRVLSFWNLQSISGKTLAYRPEYTAAKRRGAVQQWKDRLQDGKILLQGAGGTERAPMPPLPADSNGS
jgi:hypothetical protein